MEEIKRAEAAEAAESSAEQAEEAAALARAEGEAAREAERSAPKASTVPPTPEGEYMHLPLPVRAPMGKLSSWTLNREVHLRFSAFCRCEKNAKLEACHALFNLEPYVSFTKYGDTLGRCKQLAKWKARALAAGIPNDTTLAIRTNNDAIRLLALRFFFESTPGDVITADLSGRDSYIDRDLEDFLSQ